MKAHQKQFKLLLKVLKEGILSCLMDYPEKIGQVCENDSFENEGFTLTFVMEHFYFTWQEALLPKEERLAMFLGEHSLLKSF